MPFPAVRRLAISALDSLRERGYFQEAFGYECVDEGTVNGTLGSDPAAFFLRTIMRYGIWPYWGPDYSQVPANVYIQEGDLEPAWTDWDADTLFDVLEVLHDLVSEPVSGRNHTYADCGWHYSTFDGPPGRETYRDEMNQALRLHDPPYEMNDQGEVIESGPVEFCSLQDAPVPTVAGDAVVRKVENAVHRYRTRGASLDDRRHAVRDLAGVLESIRDEGLKQHMLPADEDALFQIANKFGIRHDNRKQHTGYDDVVWLPWMFYVYLASIHAVLRMREKYGLGLPQDS